MDAEILEKFFINYLEHSNLEYVIKNRIFTVKLDKMHKKLYSQEDDLVCTFDMNVSKKKKVLLLGLGNFIVDSIIGKYSNDVVISSVNIPKSDDDILGVNEKLPNLKNRSKYLITEISEDCVYILFETNIKSAHDNSNISNNVLITKNGTFDAKNIFNSSFEDSTREVIINEKIINSGIKFVQDINSECLDTFEYVHYEDMKELKTIQEDHANNQYKELVLLEDNLRFKIKEARSKSVGASNFDVKAKWNDNVKKLKVKYEKLLLTNKNKRDKIKKLFDKQMIDLEKRELDVCVKVKIYADISMRYFHIGFEDGKEYYYFPFLKNFIEKIK